MLFMQQSNRVLRNTTNLSQHLNKWHPEVLGTNTAESSAKSLTQVTLESCAFRPTVKTRRKYLQTSAVEPQMAVHMKEVIANK